MEQGGHKHAVAAAEARPVVVGRLVSRARSIGVRQAPRAVWCAGPGVEVAVAVAQELGRTCEGQQLTWMV